MAARLSKNVKALIACIVVLFAAPVIGLVVTVSLIAHAYSVVASPAVDPSQKARLLAEGISEAMNGAVFGGIICVLAIIPTVFYVVRVAGERKTGDAATPDGGS